MNGQGRSERDKVERESRGQERDVGEELLYIHTMLRVQPPSFPDATITTQLHVITNKTPAS